jgi:hypothetical protein
MFPIGSLGWQFGFSPSFPLSILTRNRNLCPSLILTLLILVSLQIALVILIASILLFLPLRIILILYTSPKTSKDLIILDILYNFLIILSFPRLWQKYYQILSFFHVLAHF